MPLVVNYWITCFDGSQAKSSEDGASDIIVFVGIAFLYISFAIPCIINTCSLEYIVSYIMGNDISIKAYGLFDS